MIHLTLDEALHVARRVIGDDVVIRDPGLLAGALARAATTIGGDNVYPTLVDKGAALVHSVVRNHALVDGNKRLGLALLVVFLGVNGHRLTMTNDQAYDLIIVVAEGRLDLVSDIATAVRRFVVAR